MAFDFPTLDPSDSHLASDNYSPVHPEVLAAIAAVNAGQAPSYGADPVTAELRATISEMLGQPVKVFPVLTGSGANIISITAATPRWGAVVLSTHGHMLSEEGGAAARLSGIPLLEMPSTDGKLHVSELTVHDWKDDFVHASQATTLNIANTTELGTVYTPAEITELSTWAHSRNMMVHLDGARIFNAMAATGATMKQLTVDAGVDIFSLGATKTGALAAEAVVVINPEIQGTRHIHKYMTQLASKSRFLSAQILALLTDDLGLSLADRSNQAAAEIAEQIASATAAGKIPQVEFTQPVQSNQLFLKLPAPVAKRMRERVLFYDWNIEISEVRWVTSWDTTSADVTRFVETLIEAYQHAGLA